MEDVWTGVEEGPVGAELVEAELVGSELVGAVVEAAAEAEGSILLLCLMKSRCSFMARRRVMMV